MSKSEDLITKIQNSYLGQGPLSVNRTEVRDDAIHEGFSDPKSFLFELIQNAVDASDEKEINIKIDLSKDDLVLAHDGNPFSEKDVWAICDVGMNREDPEAKREDATKIGYKGVGFKSVFKISDDVSIYSKDFRFSFTKSFWIDDFSYDWNESQIESWKAHCNMTGQNDEINYPWRVLPIIEERPKPSGFDDYSVITQVRLNDIGKVVDFDQEIKTILEKAQVLLFLNTEKVTIEYKGQFYTKSYNETNNKITLNNNQHWLLFTQLFPVDKANFPQNAPTKLKKLSKISISLAFEIGSDGIEVNSNRVDIFSFLPTKDRFGFPFIVNAQFLLANSRERINENEPWNEQIFKGLGKLLAKTMGDLAKSDDDKIRYNLLKLVQTPPQKEEKYKHLFYTALMEGLQDQPFLPVLEETNPKKISQVIIDKTGLSRKEELRIFIKEVLFENSSDKFLLDHKSLQNNSILDQFDMEVLNKDNILVKFEEIRVQEYLMETGNPTIFMDLITGFQNCYLTSEIIKEIQFLPSRISQVKPARELFLFEKEEDAIIEEFDFQFLHPKIMDTVDYSAKSWIKNKLEIKGVDPESVVEKISNNPPNSTNKAEVNKSVVRYLFENRSKIRNWNQLSKLNLLNIKEELKVKDDLYLSDCYNPKHKIQYHLKEDGRFIYEGYCEDKNNFEEWGIFFRDRLSVQDQIRCDLLDYFPNYNWYDGRFSNISSIVYAKNPVFKQYAHYCQNEFDETGEDRLLPLFSENNKKDNIKVVRDYLKDFNRIRFIDILSPYNIEFANIFWGSIFEHILANKEIFIKNLCRKSTFHQYEPWRKILDVNNFDLWVIRNTAIFPCDSGKMRKAEELLISNPQNELFKGLLAFPSFKVPSEILDIKINDQPVFRFNLEVSDADILNILISIYTTEKKYSSRTKKILGFIYRRIIDRDLLIKNKLEKIFTTKGEFISKDEVFYIDDESVASRPEVNSQFFIPKEFTQEEKYRLLDKLNINLIKDDSISLEGKVDNGGLDKHLSIRNEFIKLVSKENMDVSRLENLEVRSYSKITLKLGSEEVLVKAAITRKNGISILNVQAGWNTNSSIKRDVTLELTSFVGLESPIWIHDLLWMPNSLLIESLETENFEVSPQLRILLLGEEGIKIQDNNPIFKAVSSENGIRAEQKVFRRLTQIARNATSDELIKEDSAYVFESKEIKMEWIRGKNESEKYDILVTINKSETPIEKYIEVKSTVNSTFDRNGESLYFSEREWELLRNSDESKRMYFLAVVFNNKAGQDEIDDQNFDLIRMIPGNSLESITI